MKNKSTPIPFLIFSAIVFAVCVSSYVYMHTNMSRLIDRTAVARNSVLSEMTKKGYAKELSNLYERTKEERGRIRSFFIGEEKAVTFIESLESIEKKSGSEMTIASIESDKPKEDGAVIGSVKARVEANGSWVSIMKTLKLAETLPYEINISKVRLDSSGLGTASSKKEWRISFNIEASSIKK